MIDPFLADEILSARISDLEAAGTVLLVSFRNTAGQRMTVLLVPEDYRKMPGDPPVFTWREARGTTTYGGRAGFLGAYRTKQVFPDAVVWGARIKKGVVE